MSPKTTGFQDQMRCMQIHVSSFAQKVNFTLQYFNRCNRLVEGMPIHYYINHQILKHNQKIQTMNQDFFKGLVDHLADIMQENAKFKAESADKFKEIDKDSLRLINLTGVLGKHHKEDLLNLNSDLMEMNGYSSILEQSECSLKVIETVHSLNKTRRIKDKNTQTKINLSSINTHKNTVFKQCFSKLETILGKKKQKIQKDMFLSIKTENCLSTLDFKEKVFKIKNINGGSSKCYIISRYYISNEE